MFGNLCSNESNSPFWGFGHIFACHLNRKSSLLQIIDVTREFALNVLMILREDELIIWDRKRRPRPLLLENMEPRGITTGDDILEVGLDLRGGEGELPQRTKRRSNAGITCKLEMLPLKTCHGKSSMWARSGYG